MTFHVSSLCIHYFHILEQFSIFLLAKSYPFSKTQLMHAFLWKGKKTVFPSQRSPNVQIKTCFLKKSSPYPSDMWQKVMQTSDQLRASPTAPEGLPTQPPFSLSSFLTESQFVLISTLPQVAPHLREN